MKRSHATILMTVFGVLIFLGIVGLSFGVWLFASVFEQDTADERAATASFDEVRRRFTVVGPVFSMVGNDRAEIRREPPSAPPGPPLERLQVLAWDPDDESLAKVTLPFWLLRLKSGPLDISGKVMINHHHVDVTVEQIERYGPTLLVDHVGSGGDRLLVWTE
jgi:hypothetical protein